MNITFEDWIYEVCTFKSNNTKSIHDVYQSIDLTDAKLAFIDNESAENYAKSI